METFDLSVVAIDKNFFNGACRQLIVPAPDGRMGILPHHEDAVVAVVSGELKLQKEDGEWIVAVTGDGFLNIVRNEMRLVVDTVERPEEIDVERAELAKEEAEEELRQYGSVYEYHMAKAKLARAVARINVASRYHRH